MNYFAVALWLFFASAGKVCLPKDWVLEWTWPSQDLISFTLKLNSLTWEKYNWVGIGFKSSEDGAGMTGADINNFVLGKSLTDRHALSNRLPKLDTELGGNDNIFFNSLDLEQFTYTWTRPVSTLEDFDKNYYKGACFKLLWACGKMMGEVQMKHFSNDRGILEISLSEDFSIGCSPDFLSLN